jgi:tetratricopeptide (TPR) repeat protein
MSPSTKALAKEAGAWKTVKNEEEFLEARFIYQGLPEGIEERLRLREVLLAYLLGQQSTIDAKLLRQSPEKLGTEEGFQLLVDSFHDALELFSPAEKYSAEKLALRSEEKRLIVQAAQLNVAVFSPRGSELPVLTALWVLHAIEPENQEWKRRLDEVWGWLESSAQQNQVIGPRKPGTSEILSDVATIWPHPGLLEQLTNLAMARQDTVAGLFRRPIGTESSARNLLSEILFDTEALTSAALGVLTHYLRCGAVEKAWEVSKQFTDKPSDNPELRQLLSKSANPQATPADYLALARRFLPKSERLGGTSQELADPKAAMGVLTYALVRFPADIDLLVLTARVARLLPAPLLSRRYLESASTLLLGGNLQPDLQAELASERMDLAFFRLKMRMDPEHLSKAEEAAMQLRAEFAEERKRFGDTSFRLGDADIDYLLASGMVDAGKGDQADSLLAQAQKATEGDATKQLANLFIKRGEPAKAIALLTEAISSRETDTMARDTIGFVESQARLLSVLGNAQEVSGNLTEARRAWAQAVRNMERLMMEFLRRKDLSASAETTFEVGRLYYLLGRHEEGIRRLFEAIEQDNDRDQSYLDGIAFLIQRGETDPALAIYRRAMARPGRTLSEYVKVYASLWIVDLTRRSLGTPDPGAFAYLSAIASRAITMRPLRTTTWYTQLARYTIGKIDYRALWAAANSVGKRAEANFYEAMRQLELGSSSQAHALWMKVIESKMVSFFEYEMAARYLRCGAPIRPVKDTDEAQTI